MALAGGTRLGPYEIEAPVGFGGMGEVYRARDTRLERAVALKVLPTHLAERPDLRQRLEREARAVSSLSHPNICALYDVGHEAGIDYLVMEFIDGETLADRLARGSLSLEQTLKFGIQIADALDAAHRKGIVHRDLKPGNIMLAGTAAKLLDFGLAKTESALGSGEDLTQAATASRPLTAAGTVLGTCQYMAPEQLEGKEADRRTDIFALGAVLYEMATGRRAFAGGSRASLIGAIMHESPAPMADLQPTTPPAFDRLVRTCLAKDPADRWETAHDVKLQLAWIAEEGSAVGVPAPAAAGRRSREKLAWAAAAIAAAAALLLAIGLVLREPDEPRQVRFQIVPEAQLAKVGSPRLSPDGRHLAFQGIDAEGTSQIWLRELDSTEARPISGTEGARLVDGGESRPFWSPDSRHVAFFVGTTLKRVPVGGGPAETICEAAGGDGSWSSRGEIIFDGSFQDPLLRVAAAGGIAKAEVTVNSLEGVRSVGWPEFLPGGTSFLYLAMGSDGKRTVRLRELDAGEDRPLTPTDSRVQYVEPGYLLYVRGGTLVAHSFDARGGRLSGEPIPLADNIGATATGEADFSASRDGTLAYRGGASRARLLQWFDRAGRPLAEMAQAAEFWYFRIAPDGTRVATHIYDSEAGHGDIWVHDLERGVASRLSFESGFAPAWSADGRDVIYSRRDGGTYQLIRKDADGTGAPEVLWETGHLVLAGDVSGDGRRLVAAVLNPDTNWDLWVLPLDGSGEPAPLLATEFRELRPGFSPDGSWLVYESDQSGRAEIYVRPFPGPGGQWQVSTEGGSEPMWSGDGRGIFHLDAEGRLVSVAVEAGATFRAAPPEPLFSPPLYPYVARERFVPTPDGGRFLVLSTPSGESIRAITVVLNWRAGLED